MAVNPDKYEANNSMATATPLTQIHGELTGLTLHSGDADYFKFTLKRAAAGNDRISVDGSATLELYDQAGNLRYDSSYGSLNLYSFYDYQPGTYYLKVYNANSDVVPSYTLKYDLPSAQTVNPDKFESAGGNNTLATATAITGVSGSFKSLSAHNDTDVDYFKIHLNKDGSTADVVTINYVQNDGGLSIKLLNSAGTQISHKGYAYGDTPTISFDGKAKGDYYIKVEGSSSYDWQPNNYSLSWSLPSNFVPKADKYENNDTMAKAKSLTGATGTIKSLTHHTEKDADFFKYKLSRTGKSYDKISVDGDPNVYLQLFNSSGKSLKKGKTVSLSGQKAGTYYVKAYNAAGDYTKAYSLSWNFNPLKDKYEGNDSRSKATALTGESGTLKSLTHHTTTDADYFKFKLDHKGLSKDKISVSGDSNVYLQLISSAGKVLKTGKSVSLLNQKAGTYYVKAYNAKKQTTDSYSLAWDFTPPKDAYEGSKGNNTKGTATLLKSKSGTIKNLTHHTGKDVDWFKFTLTSKGKSNNYISLSGDKNASFTLYDSKGVAYYGNWYTYNLEGKAAGTYYIKTTNEAGASTRSYSLSWDLNPPKDAFESNDTIKTATKLYVKKGKITNLTHHTAKDADYFKFTLDSKGTSKDKVTISGDSAVYLRIYNSAGKQVKGAGKTLNMSGLSAGTYYAKAYNSKNKTTDSYTLSWDLNKGTAGDMFEKNNTMAAATLLPGAESVTGISGSLNDYLRGSIHTSKDVDYYKIHLDQKGTASDKVTMADITYQGNLDMQLLNSKGKVLATSNNVSGQSESLSLANRAAGDYYVKVYGNPGKFGGDYSLSWYLPSSSQASTTHYGGSIAAS